MDAAVSLGTFHQAHHADDLESCFACRFNGLNGGGASSANVVHDHHPRTFLMKAFNAFRGAVRFFCFTDEEPIDVPARRTVARLVVSAAVYLLRAQHSDTDYDRIGAHGQSADGLRTPAALHDLV